MKGRLAATCLAVTAAVGTEQAWAAPQTVVIVHVENDIRNPRLTIQFQNQSPTGFGRASGRDGFFTHYRHVVTWPATGPRQSRHFRLFAKVQSGPARAFYLRLRHGPPEVEIYVFNRRYTECERKSLAPADAVEDVFEQLAEAEAMLTITNPDGLCSDENLVYWTRIWVDRVKRLWRTNEFVQLNPNVIDAIRQAHNRPRRYMVFMTRTIPLPADFQDVVRLDRELSTRFN